MPKFDNLEEYELYFEQLEQTRKKLEEQELENYLSEMESTTCLS